MTVSFYLWGIGAAAGALLTVSVDSKFIGLTVWCFLLALKELSR